MSLIIKGMKLPQHAAANGEKDTAYKCVILVHPDNSVELVIDSKFASLYDNGHNIQRYPLTELPTPHGRLIDADKIEKCVHEWYDVGEYVFADTIRNADTIKSAAHGYRVRNI